MPGTVVITGGNAGIGAAMACAFAVKEHPVKIVCRSRERAGAFIDEMSKKGITIGLIEGDLGTIASAGEAARRVLKEAPDCGIFIHNAGMWPVEKTINADGFEQSFVTNHLAPFVMNALLETMFRQNRTRIVQVSAGLYVAGMRDCEAAASGSNFSLMRTYATTKLMNLVATMEFARRWRGSGAVIDAIHPGVVNTGLGAMPGVRGAFLRAAKRFLLTPAQGAEAPVRLALDASPGIGGGRYFDRFTEKPLEAMARDERFSAEVWAQAVRLTGIGG